MESNSNEKIIKLVEEVINLLQQNDEERWVEVMKNLLQNYIFLTHSKNKREAANLIMKVMLGGMGSLSDVVLHKNGKPLIEENNRLNKVLDELYEECKHVQ